MTPPTDEARACAIVGCNSPRQYVDWCGFHAPRSSSGRTDEARADDVLLKALSVGPIYAGQGSPWWDALHRLARQGKCRGEFVPFDGWRWTL